MNERRRALQILERVESESLFADRLVGPIDSRSDAFIRTLVFGVLRWRGQLDYLIQRLADRPLRRIQPKVLQILRMGLCQIRHMEVAPHAAVSETVSLVTQEAPAAKGFVNAVLRSALRQDLDALLPAGRDSVSLAVRYAHPEWMVSRWISSYGLERTERILEANQRLSQPDLLINTTMVSIGEAIARLESMGVRFSRSPLVEGMLRLEQSTASLASLIEEGWFYPMDEGSALVASLLEGEGGVVLDLAAAPGGKSLVVRRKGRSVVSHDLSLGRLAPFRAIHERFFGEAGALVVGDGRSLPFRGKFAAVLIDAPCSATGTLRKNPEIKWRLRPDDPGVFARLQRELLAEALKAADVCLYSTCSLEKEENEDVVETVLGEHEDFELFDLAKGASREAREWIRDGVLRLTPDAGTDGFTAHGLQRRGGSG